MTTRPAASATLAVFTVSMALLAFALFVHSTTAPALQYDESWWGLLIQRIATEPGQWPIFGMSSYTLTHNQYLSAALFRWLGPSVALLRFIPKLEVLAGVGLISAALHVSGRSLAGAILPGLIAFFPALVMNQRWTVELTTFSVLVTGLVSLGLALRRERGSSTSSNALILAGAWLGTTSHILLIAPLMALWFWLWSHGLIRTREDRRLVTTAAIGIVSFVIAVFLRESRALEIAALALAVLGGATLTWTDLSKSLRTWARWIVTIPGLLILVPFAVHLDGNWQALQYTGDLSQPLWRGAILIPLTLLLWFSRRGFASTIPRVALPLLPITLLATQAMVGRLGARFLEIPFLMVAVALAALAARLPLKRLVAFASVWVVCGGGLLWQNYFEPCIHERQVARAFRLGRMMKDSSEDFVSKMPLVRRLGEQGCGLEALPEIERGPELRFLALGDWPISKGPCRVSK